MAEKDVLILEVNVVDYVNKEGKPAQFTRIGVTVNGIFLELKPADNTVRQVLNNHYGI